MNLPQEFGWCGQSGGNQNTHWPAPAKINLFLHITGRRADGYHLLQTIFQLLDQGDELSFTQRPDKKIRLSVVPADPQLAGDDNLVMRAATALCDKALAEQRGPACGVDITLYKKLPLGGGLGGGSSDAATTLVALNHLWQLGFDTSELAALALTLGADVPVFVHGHSAWGEGVGELLEPLALPLTWYVVIHPGIHVSTGPLFSHSQLTRDCPPITIRRFRNGEQTSNVFQALVCSQHSEVSWALSALVQAARSCCVKASLEPRMTGTGSCVFAGFSEQSAAQKVLSAVTDQQQNVEGFVARGVDHSALVRYT